MIWWWSTLKRRSSASGELPAWQNVAAEAQRLLDAFEHSRYTLSSTVRPGVLNAGQDDMLASYDLVEVDIEEALFRFW